MSAEPAAEKLVMSAARMPRGLLDELTDEAKRRGIARSAAVREAVIAWLDTEPEPA